jgi:hypothetical protein
MRQRTLGRVAGGACLLTVLLGFACPGGPAFHPGEVPAAAWNARVLAYLRFATQVFAPGSPLNVINHLERERLEAGYDVPEAAVPLDAWDASFAKMAAREDTADFDALYLLNLYLGYRDHPVLAPGLAAKVEDALLAFKYWYTEPRPVLDNMTYWSENHQIIFHTLEYLAGQLFPDRVFANDGRTGVEKRAHARALILRWLDQRARIGFDEFHSNVYYQKDVTPLLTLAEWADDPEIATRAAMVLDLVLFDLALHVHRCTFGATHGRTYIKDKKTGLDEDTWGTAMLLFGEGGRCGDDFRSRGEPGATLLARARKYRVPEVLRRVAAASEPFVDRERMGIFLDELASPFEGPPVAPFGLDFDDEEDLPIWWGMGAYTTWPVVALTLRMADKYELWDTEAFQPFVPARDFVANDPETARNFAWLLARTIASPLLSQVNTYTLRTPDYMLSTAQDYRKGSRADQAHAWQATFDPRAIVFTTHPAETPPSPTNFTSDAIGYWNGTASWPRSAQHGSAAIHLYAPQYVFTPAPPFDAISRYEPYTHAWFPTERFDEVMQEDGWTFGRKSDGYVALWSWRPATWRDHDPATVFTDGMTAPFDLVALGGPDDVWIVECGRRADWGSFEAFRAAILAAPIEVVHLGSDARTGIPKGFDVVYGSPSQGEMRFGWDGPLVVAGEEVAITGYPRLDNPWSQTAYDASGTIVSDGDWGAVLDFRGPRRWLVGPPPAPGP